MAQASSRITIHAPVAAIWAEISRFDAADRYLPGVVNCMSDGAKIRARRTLTNADGSMIVERLEALDEVNHRLRYALLSDTPFDNCLTTIAVHDLGQSQAEVTWRATFEADGLPASEAVSLLEGALQENCLALKRFIEAGGQ